MRATWWRGPRMGDQVRFVCGVGFSPRGLKSKLQYCKWELCGAGFQPADPLSSGSSRLERRLRPRMAAPQKGTDRILQLPLKSTPQRGLP
jgi:hypothetical protein